jgi:predicted 3-demethylubiquinone-9 3-methyltransferase (glyoxalase superfamily)
MNQKITPSLWFAHNAEEAVTFYSSVFRNGKVNATTRYPDAGKEIHGMEPGSVLTIDWEIEGHRFIAMNAGPVFTFTPAISFMVNFDPSQDGDARERIDDVWEQLALGGEVLMAIGEYPFSKRYGWIKDKFGVSWQLILTNPEGEPRPRIIPTLMYAGDVAGKAEEAIGLYTKVFKDASVGMMARYPAGSEPDKEGTLMFADFRLEGQWFAAMDSARAHDFTFNEAISLMIECDSQEEIDHYWQLSAVKEAEQCGWLKDAFGVSWQVAPRGMDAMLNDPDKEKANRAMGAMMQMKKIDMDAIKAAYEG